MVKVQRQIVNGENFILDYANPFGDTITARVYVSLDYNATITNYTLTQNNLPPHPTTDPFPFVDVLDFDNTTDTLLSSALAFLKLNHP